MVIWKEGNVLFNNALNPFYLRLYGVRHMIKDHSDSESGNPLPPLHGLFFLISSKGSFICTISQTGKYIPRPLLHQLYGRKEMFYLMMHSIHFIYGALAGTRNSSMGLP